jgi:flagellar motor switch protein FliM
MGDEVDNPGGFPDRVDGNWAELKQQFEKMSQLLNYSLVASLSDILRRDVILDNFAMQQPVAYEDFLVSMNSPSCIGRFTSEISGITALLALDLNSAYAIIDIILGGQGDNSLKAVRALTDLELKFMCKPMEQILANLDGYLNLTLQLADVYTYPSQINLNSSHELVVPLVFNLMESTMADETRPTESNYTITLCLPHTAVESAFRHQNKPSVDLKKTDKYCQVIQKSPFLDMPLRLQVHFPQIEVTIGKLMAMKTGEIIVLDTHKNDDVIEVELLLEDYPRFKGKLGAIGRYKAVEII